jgi:hypothetical protein
MKPPRRLLDWVRTFCDRPGMYLASHPDYREPNLSILRAWMQGYDAALTNAGLPTEEEPFRSWVFRKRPDLKDNPLWYGEALLAEMAGEPLRVLAQIRAWIDEYDRDRARLP